MENKQNNPITYERHNHLIYCYIQLAGQKRKLIGIINELTRTLSKRISKQLHTFKKSNSYAIANELLQLDFDFIVIESGYNTYKTTRKYFLEKSEFMHFGKYELQKFLPISEFGMDRAENWEQEQQALKINKVLIVPIKEVLQLELFEGV